MTDFTKIKSKFAKEKIKNLDYNGKNREYMELLLRIEGLVQGKHYGIATGYMIKGLKEKYPKEWDAIGLELDPYHKTLAEETKEEIAEDNKIKKQLAKEEFNEEKESIETWKQANGL